MSRFPSSTVSAIAPSLNSGKLAYESFGAKGTTESDLRIGSFGKTSKRAERSNFFGRPLMKPPRTSPRLLGCSSSLGLCCVVRFPQSDRRSRVGPGDSRAYEVQSRPINFDRGGRCTREKFFRLMESRRILERRRRAVVFGRWFVPGHRV